VKETSKKTKSLKKRNITALCILVLMVVFLLIFPTQTGIFENNTVNENDGYTIAEHNETEIDEQSYLDIGADSDNAQNESNENQNGYAKDDLSNDLADPNDHLYDDEAYENQDYLEDTASQNPQTGFSTPNGLVRHDGPFELPITGSTGWAASSLAMRSQPTSNSTSIQTLQPGQAFVIFGEDGEWWNVRLSDGTEGWVLRRNCFINLPDVVPSIVYNITNAHSSVMRSNMTDIPGITGQALYEAFGFNQRLGRDEFIVPALYSTSLKIMQAQRAALADGNTLIVYEVFRPRSTQQGAVSRLRTLMNENAAVYNAINSPPWNISWFIGTSLSNHQRGAAVDMSLGAIVRAEVELVSGIAYWRVIEHTPFEMPTAMHELSTRAVLLSRPITTTSPDAWRTVPFADTITQGAILLLQYADEAGLTPMASEWWHFNDLTGRTIAMNANIVGEFYTPTIYSEAIS